MSPAHVQTSTPEKAIQEPVVTVHSAVHGQAVHEVHQGEAGTLRSGLQYSM